MIRIITALPAQISAECALTQSARFFCALWVKAHSARVGRGVDFRAKSQITPLRRVMFALKA